MKTNQIRDFIADLMKSSPENGDFTSCGVNTGLFRHLALKQSLRAVVEKIPGLSNKIPNKMGYGAFMP
jgi:hypothetical protein